MGVEERVWMSGSGRGKSFHLILEGSRTTVCGLYAGTVTVDGNPSLGAVLLRTEAELRAIRPCMRCHEPEARTKPSLDRGPIRTTGAWL